MIHLPDHLKDCGKTPEALGIMDFALACLDADYGHRVGPMVRRAELKADIARFRGEASA